MFKDALRNVEGLAIYPTISFVIFFLFFIGLIIYVTGLSKSHISEMGEMPLNLDEDKNNIKLKKDNNEQAK